MNRKHFLDNIRWVTVLLVLLYHVVYFYNNKGVFGGIGGWVDDPKAQPQDVVMYLLYPWFMMLLFLVAGISSRYALGKITPADCLHPRRSCPLYGMCFLRHRPAVVYSGAVGVLLAADYYRRH